MRAMAIHEHGGPETIQASQLPDPTPGPHDLLVRVHACGLNPVDTKVRATGLGMTREFPLVMGYDVSGVVEAVGDRVDGFRVGEAVYGSPSLARPGANAELVCIDARMTAHRPETLDATHAAALPLVTLTAWESLHGRAGIHDGETVLVHAGAGGVGHIAVQLAKLHQCRVITTASRDESITLCRELGADVVINHREEDFVKRVMEETDGRGCQVVLDTVGGEVFTRSLECVALNGRLVSIVYSEPDGIFEKLFRKNVTLHLEFMGVPGIYGVGMEQHAEILRTVGELVDAGKLRVHVSRRMALDQIVEAHRAQETGRTVGKIVMTVAD